MRVLPLLTAAAAVGWVAYRRKRLGRVELVLWGVAVAGLVLYGIGLVELPNVEKLLEDLGTTLGKWTYGLVGGLAFLETGAFVGLLAPGETAILVGGLVAGQGQISVVVLLGITWAAAVAGDCTSFYLGRRLGRDFMLRHGPKVKITEERLEKVEDFFERRGGTAVFLGRFIGLARAITPFVAGASRMSFARFLPFDVLGAGLWVSILVLLGYVFWRSFNRLVTAAGQGIFVLGSVILLVWGGVTAVKFLRVADNRRRADEWLESKPVLRPVWGAVRPVLQRIVLPAGRIARRHAPSKWQLEAFTLMALAAVGGFAFGGLGSLVSDADSVPLDAQAADVAGSVRSDLGVDVVALATGLGSYPAIAVLVLVTAAYLVRRRRYLEAAMLVVATVLVQLGVDITKEAWDRPRPANGLVGVRGSAFPSGHATYAVAWLAVAVTLVRVPAGLVRRTAVVAAAGLLAVAIGLSRVFLRVHYLSDVAAGWGLGVAIFALCGLVALVVEHLRQNQPA